MNRLDGGDPHALHGTTINRMQDYYKQDRVKDVSQDGVPNKVGADGCTWKSSGFASIDGTLYWVIARANYGELSGDPKRRQPAQNASIIKSTDYGLTWTRSAAENLATPVFAGSDFAAPYFIDYGKDRLAIDGADRYVYAISNNGFWDNGDKMILGRVARDRIGQLAGSDWQFFTGGDGASSTQWTHDVLQANPLLSRPGQLGESAVNYLPAHDRYMMITWYYPAGSGAIYKGAGSTTIWDIYESPKPWGPWTRIQSRTWSPQGFYCPAICPKFQTANRVYVITGGDGKYYRLSLVPLDLEMNKSMSRNERKAI
jgi:hypothetical protein